MLVNLFSPNGTYDNIFLANYAYINLNDQLTRVPGIASVTVFGAGQYAMRCWVKPDRLAKLGVTVPEIIKAIQSQNTCESRRPDWRRACPQRDRTSLMPCGPRDGYRLRRSSVTSWFGRTLTAPCFI